MISSKEFLVQSFWRCADRHQGFMICDSAAAICCRLALFANKISKTDKASIIRFIKLYVKVKHNIRSPGDHKTSMIATLGPGNTKLVKTFDSIMSPQRMVPMYHPNVSHQWSSLFVGVNLHRPSLESTFAGLQDTLES